MLNSLIIEGDKSKKCPEQKFKNLSQEVLDISISYPNIQKYSKKLKNWGRRCNFKFTIFFSSISILEEVRQTDIP